VSKFIAGHGRHDEVKSPSGHRFYIELHINKARHHDDLHGLERLKCELDHIRPSAVRKQRFRKYQVRWICLPEQRQSLSEVSQPMDLDRLAFQRLF